MEAFRTIGKDMFGGGTIVMTDEVVRMDVMTQRQRVWRQREGDGESKGTLTVEASAEGTEVWGRGGGIPQNMP